MTEQATTTDRRKPKRSSNGKAHAPVLVSGPKLALHFGVVRQRIDQLVQQGVIERRGDGLFDQDVSRLKYFDHLRSEHRRSPRSAADAEFTAAKAELIRIRIAEKKRELVLQTDVDELIDNMCGIFLTAMSGMPAQIAGPDLPLRRKIEKIVYETRVAIADAAHRKGDECGEPELSEQ